MNNQTKIALVVLVALAGTIGAVYAVSTWSGGVTWVITDKNFKVYDSASGGAELASPYTVSAPPTAVGTYTYTYYLENTGNTAINVVVGGAAPTGSGNTASWSQSGSYSLPVSTTRVAATLTLNLASSGSYTWTFSILP